MDFMTLRIVFTVVSFFVFLGIIAWAYNRKQTERFNEDALIPFHEEDGQITLRAHKEAQ
jgi:cytochrome c oxidase cbb3-type subunit 4